MSSEAPSGPDGQPALERRLATILSADVAGYSRMMGSDEEATVQALRGHRAVFDMLLRQHHGRIFNTAGDAILAEFPSAVEAVRCATEIQTAIMTRNEQLPPERQMLFRMGINLGDVIVSGGDLLGDGVNVASRIQTAAEPGGICISGSVYDQIQNKLTLQIRPLGEKTYKNIAQPVRTFTITHGESGALPAPQRRSDGKSARAIGVTALAVAVLAAAGYWVYRDRQAAEAEQAALGARLAAETKAAEQARIAAQEQIRRAAEAEARAERERSAAESAKREAALQSQLASADDARRRAEADRKRSDEERQRAEADKRAADARAQAEEKQRAEADKRAADARAQAVEKQRATPAAAQAEGFKGGAAGTPPAPASAGPLDATYDGQFCSFPGDPSRRNCWRVPLRFVNGVAEVTWQSLVPGKQARARATIAEGGLVKVTIDGWNPADGMAMSGALNGRLTGNRIDTEGRWAPGAPLAGNWTRRP